MLPGTIALGRKRAVVPSGPHALSLNLAASPFPELTRTQGSGANLLKYSLSAWFKTNMNNAALLIGDNNGDGINIFRSTGDDQAQINCVDASAAGFFEYDDAPVFDDVWHHILMHWDTANATASQRLRVWVDGAEITGSLINTPSQNTNSALCASGNTIYVSCGDDETTTGTLLVDEIAYFDGELIAVTDLRDSSTHEPKDLSGLTFGANGFWLTFDGGTASTSGVDASPNGNNFTPSGIVDGDLVTDVP